MTALIGSIAVGVALVAAVFTMAIAVFASRTGSRRFSEVSRHGVYLVFASLLVASAALVHAFVTHDYSIQYVQHYSDSRMPLVYLVSAFWGGQSGSLLFWAVVLSGSSAIAVTTARHRVPDLMPVVHFLLMGITTFFLVMLVFLSSPFETYYLVEVPTRGDGLNPILQNYWMAIHPPSLLTGYSTFAVPFAFGAAALVKRRYGVEWIRVTRRWLLISWTFLSLGCILGGRWAYEELGWGGYWAWDPVENAAILPWFTATALIHSVMIQERRGMLKRWNFTLLVLTFWLTIFGTFLTRSGMIASVHTFAESAIGPIFLGAVIFIWVAGSALLISRWKDLAGERRLESAVSREGVFLLNNWLMLAFMFVVLWGTIGPKFKDLVAGTDTVLGPPWFNKFAVPIGLALLLAMSIGTLIAWRRANRKNIQRNFTKPFLVSILLTAVIGYAYYLLRLSALRPQADVNAWTLAGTTLWLSVFGTVIIVSEFWGGMRTRVKKAKSGYIAALSHLFSKHRRRYGGYLVHLGFIMICLGIAGNAFKVKQTVTMEVGDSVVLGDYLLTFDGWAVEQHPGRIAELAELSLQQCDRNGDELVASSCSEARTITPARFDYNDYSTGGQGDPMKVTSEIAILTGPLEDVYVAISGGSRGSQVASFEMYVNPLTFWVWFGGVILVGAVVICMWPERLHVPKRVRSLQMKPIFDGAAMVLIALLPFALFGFGETAWAQPEDQPPGPSLVEAERVDGTRAAHLYGMVLCECPSCGFKTVDQCQPGCGEGRRERARIDQMLSEGSSDDEILAAIVADRGTGAIAIPDDKAVAWGIPILAIALGFFAVVLLLGRLKRGARDGSGNRPIPAVAVTANAKGALGARLDAELEELD